MEQIDQEHTPKRPGGLTTLGILTFINAGYTALVSLFGLLNGPMSTRDIQELNAKLGQSINEMKKAKLDFFVSEMEKIGNMAKIMNTNHNLAQLLNFAVAGLAIYGVLLMWKKNKLGFQLYLAYSVVAVVLPMVFVGFSGMSILVLIFGMIISAVFCLIYYRQRKWYS